MDVTGNKLLSGTQTSMCVYLCVLKGSGLV